MGDFSDHERSLLRALQEDDSPSEMDAARIKERVLLSASVAAAAGVATTATKLTGATTSGAGAQAAAGAGAAATSLGPGAATTTAASTAGASLWKALLVTGATLGIGGGAYSVVGSDAPEARVVERVESPTQQASVGQVQEAAPPKEKGAEESTAEQEVEEETAAQTPAKPVRTTQRAPGPGGDLKAEAALLSRAQSALQKGQAQAAIAALSEHRQRFPRGVLAGEREAALSVAYCTSGDLARGRSRAQSFIAKNPKSPMVQRLQAACKLPAE